MTISNTPCTYALLDERLRALGFIVHTQEGKARIYQHEQTAARIILPDAPFNEDVPPHHLAVVCQVLEVENLDETDRGMRSMDLNQRRQAVQRIDSVRAKMLATYGEMPDSTALIREDRER